MKKALLFLLALTLSVVSAQAVLACGPNDICCVQHDDGGATCCGWSGGVWIGCVSVDAASQAKRSDNKEAAKRAFLKQLAREHATAGRSSSEQ